MWGQEGAPWPLLGSKEEAGLGSQWPGSPVRGTGTWRTLADRMLDAQGQIHRSLLPPASSLLLPIAQRPLEGR
jgi:hypothetical protein